MSWDCPYLKNDICELNKIGCTPALGNCVLRDKAVPVSRLKKNKISKDKSGERDKKGQTGFKNKKRSE